MIDFIAPIGPGIGDLLVSLPAVQRLIDAERGMVILVARTPVQEELAARIWGLQCAVPEDYFEALTRGTDGSRLLELEPDNHWFNLRDHPLQRDWWWGSPEFEAAFGRITIDAIVERIAGDLGIPRGTWGIVPLKCRRCEAADAAAGRVLFVPATDASPKLWRDRHWLALARALEARGVTDRDDPDRSQPSERRARIAVIGPPEQAPVAALRGAGLDWIPTPSLHDAIDAVSAARAVVAVDTGLFHLAVQQRVPAVGLFRRESVFRRERPGVYSLCAPGCDPACVAADVARSHNRSLVAVPDTAAGWSCVLPEEARCMARLQPEEVLRTLVALEVLEA